jgi:probable phosphoglycerate mutase
MFKSVFLAIRHGQTAWNAQGRFQGLADVPLSPEGRARTRLNCARLAALFAVEAPGWAPRRILTSPLGRARETADALRAAMDLPADAIRADDRLVEAGFGIWEGLTTLEVKERFPEERRRRKAERWTFSPPGGCSYDDLRVRLEALLGELEDAPRTVLVTHTGNLRVLMTLAGGMARDEAVRAPVPQDALFRFEGGRMSAL